MLCVVKNLFDEYRFFHEYPERELRTTAEVYGGIIREGVVTWVLRRLNLIYFYAINQYIFFINRSFISRGIQVATAIRRIIEGLQAEQSQLWTFGLVALNACRTSLYNYPKVCQMIATISTYSRIPVTLREYITAGIQNLLPASQSAEREAILWSGSGTRSMAPIGSGIGGVGGVNSMSFLASGPNLPSSGINVMGMKFPAPKDQSQRSTVFHSFTDSLTFLVII